jgi:hypothetical protein
LAEIGET